MLLGVISDTHGQIETTHQAVLVMEEHGVETVIHCGDVGDPAVVPLLRPFAAHFVAGNCDSESTLRRTVESAGQTFHGRVGQLELEGRKIVFLHGDNHLALERLLDENQWDLLAYGHTHHADCRRVGQTLLLNPGALFRCQNRSIALVELPELDVTPVILPRP